MKVLLTGSAGFIGSAIQQALSADGHEVVEVDLMVAQAHHNTQARLGTHLLDVRTADTDWAEVFAGVDAVMHQAALVGVESSAADLPAYASHNDVGTAALLAGMARHGVDNLVLASSMVVYGEGRYACPDHGSQEPAVRTRNALDAGHFENPCPLCGQPLSWLAVSEDAPLRPRSGYAASKVAQEHYAGAWARNTGGRVIALRYHNVYGPGMPRDTSYCGVAAMFRSAIENDQPPLVFEDGQQTRDFVHVSDVARANVLALGALREHQGSAMTAYNVASGHPFTIADVAAALTHGQTLQPVITGQYRLGDVRHIVASAQAADQGLGFRAAVDPVSGIRGFAHAPLRQVANR